MIVDSWSVLQAEAGAEAGSFLLTVRQDLVWDPALFGRLEAALRDVCAQMEDREHLDRWLAEFVWYLNDWLPSWTRHPQFPRPDPDYHERCIERVWDLAYWFFTGTSPQLESWDWAHPGS